MMHLIVCSYHVTYAFYSESKLCSCLKVKELLAPNSRYIENLSEFKDANPQPIICKRQLIHLAKLAKLLSCVVSTYLYGAFDCVFLSCHKCVLE